jgi:hypothetical protein
MKKHKLFLAAGSVALAISSAFAGGPEKRFASATAIYTALGTLLFRIASSSHLTTTAGNTFRVEIGGITFDVYNSLPPNAAAKVWYQ